MRVLRTTELINNFITSVPDRTIADLLIAHLRYVGDDGGEPLSVVVIEPSDMLATLDDQFDGKLFINHYSGRRFGEPGFVPCFEALEEHKSFYEMFFIEGDEGVSVIVPRAKDIDSELLALCAALTTPFEETSS